MGKYREKCLWVEVSKIERFIKELKREAERERNTDKPMNANQVAEFLGVHRYEVYRMITDEGLPVLKLGLRRFRFDPKEVKKWMRSRKSKKGKGKKGIKRQVVKEIKRLGDEEISRFRDEGFEGVKG